MVVVGGVYLRRKGSLDFQMAEVGLEDWTPEKQ